MLHNPEGAFRSGTDAILLAAWANNCLKLKYRSGKYDLLHITELGCGNGTALLALAMQNPKAQLLGLDKNKASIDSATLNAHSLGFESRARFAQADMGAPCSRELRQQSQLVIANPPWRKTNSGEPCGSTHRQQTIYCQNDTLYDFCRFAFELLVYHGLFCMIFEASRLVDICITLSRNRLGLRMLLPVASFEDKPVSRILVMARKLAADDTRILPTLILHERTATGIQWTKAGRQFSSWLAESPFISPVEQ